MVIVNSFQRELALSATMSEIPRVIDFVSEASAQAGVTPAVRFDLQLATEEACCNVIEHAYGGSGGSLHIRFKTRDGDVIITVRDHGRPFDPDAVAEPDMSIPLEDRSIGGLGLYLMRKLMDEVRFTFSEAGNTLRMVKRGALPGEPPTAGVKVESSATGRVVGRGSDG